MENNKKSTPTLVSILIRRLKKGATYADFRKNWLPDPKRANKSYYGIPVRVLTARNLKDPDEIISIGLVKLPPDIAPEVAIEQARAMDQARHDNIDPTIDSTTLQAFYQVIDDDDLS